MASDMIKLGGLWSGKDKESENHPTHIMYLSQVETQGQGQRQGDETDEFFDDQAFQRGQQRVAQGGHMAPEDVVPLPEEEYTTVRRSQPRPQQARPEERPAQRMGPGTGREAGF